MDDRVDSERAGHRAPTRAIGSRRELRAGSIVGRTFSVWLRGLIPFSAIAFLFLLPVAVFSMWISRVDSGRYDQHRLLEFVRAGGMLVGTLLSGTIASDVLRMLRGQPAQISTGFRLAFSQLPRLVATGVIASPFIVGSAIIDLIPEGSPPSGLRTIVTLIAIVPLLVLQLSLCVCVPAAAVERLGVGAAVKRSWALTSGRKGQIFSAMLVLGLSFVPIYIAWGVFLALTIRGEDRTFQTFGLGVALSQQILGLIVSVPYAVFGTILYHDLRTGKEGAAIEDLVKVFE